MPGNVLHHEKPYICAEQDKKGVLRVVICGSVDDGKSTLLGRMLYDLGVIPDDHLISLSDDSKKFGTAGGGLDFSLLVDGLSAEREQGITIDVAYRFFETCKRKFIVADAPGHAQYTRNMATGASTADLAIIIVDARKGILPQTRRHSFIASLLGIKHVIVAINKMDLVGYAQEVYGAISSDYQDMAKNLGFHNVDIIPLSALRGDNVLAPSLNMKWYAGQSLLLRLDSIDIVDDIVDSQESRHAFRMPVQVVIRPHSDFRGFAGEVASGAICPGDDIMIMPSRRMSRVDRIVTYDGDLDFAAAGKSITLTLSDEIDISRGDVITAAARPCGVSDIFKARIVWMSEKEMVAGRQYLFRLATCEAICTLSRPDYCINVDTFEHLAAKTIKLNETGVCDVFLDRPVAFETYEENKNLGAFILVDRLTFETVAMGVIQHAMRRSENVHAQNIEISQIDRAGIKGQKPFVLWMTGLSGSGKSTIANALEKKLFGRGCHTMILDGDNVRRALSRDLGFSEADRAENIRRVAEVARLMVDAGLIVIVSLISPFRAERRMARNIIGDEYFLEAFVNTPLSVAESRDVKGLYKKARAGEIPNFTGTGSPYEEPDNPNITLNAATQSADSLADGVLEYLFHKGFIV